MAHAGNGHPDTFRNKNYPDSLQDLCIFYCMNNLEILVESLNKINEINDDISSMLSLLLGNKLLDYYLQCCLPDINNEDSIAQFMQNSQLCNEVFIKRQDILNSGNVIELANNTIKKLNLTVFDEDCFSDKIDSYKLLLKNNLSYLTNVSLCQKCDEGSFGSLLKLLCGEVGDDDFENEGIDSGATGDNWFSIEVANTKYHAFQIRNLNVSSQPENTASVSRSPIPEQFKSNLKSFSYEQVYTGSHPWPESAQRFRWFYSQLSKVLLYNKQLQSFSFATNFLLPVEWFLSQPLLHCLKNLHFLCLSFEYHERTASSEDLGLPYTETFFSNLPVLENLHHLDISCSPTSLGNAYCFDDSMVELFVQAIKNMPHLKSLDVSYTNLSSVIGHTNQSSVNFTSMPSDQDLHCSLLSVKECEDHCMPGFEGRQFDYLGLYGNTEACGHKFIPAHRVSGNVTIDQLLTALWSLQHNNSIMIHVFTDLLEWAQAYFLTYKHRLSLTDGWIAYMVRLGGWDDDSNTRTVCIEEKTICTALHCLYIVLRNDEMHQRQLSVIQKRQILERLLVICHTVVSTNHWRSSAQDVIKDRILRIAMLLMIILELETVTVYSYRFEQYIQVLMEVFNSRAKKGQKMLTLRLLHSACRVSQEYKQIAGTKMELVKKLLLIVMEKVTDNGGDDDAFEKVWSILWTLTDEVPSNCELFVASSGCQISKTCIQKFPEAKSLLRKITGAMNNVSENSSLFPQLMKEDLVNMFSGMLWYNSEEDYDVSSHASGFLIMLASHGPEAWTVQEPDRQTVLNQVEQVMQKWDINKPKGVQFRSLSPMLTQIENTSTPVAQYWGAWLICNLVIVKPQRYCAMLESEDGLRKIDAILRQGGQREDLVALLEKIQRLTLEYKRRQARNEIPDDMSD